MQHIRYQGNVKLVNGEAQLQRNTDGVLLIDTRELTPGRYKIELHASGVGGMQAGVNDTAAKKVESLSNGEQKNHIHLVALEIKHPEEPVKLFLTASDKYLGWIGYPLSNSNSFHNFKRLNRFVSLPEEESHS